MKVCEIQKGVAVSEIRRQLAAGTRLAAVERPHSAGDHTGEPGCSARRRGWP